MTNNIINYYNVRTRDPLNSRDNLIEISARCSTDYLSSYRVFQNGNTFKMINWK